MISFSDFVFRGLKLISRRLDRSRCFTSQYKFVNRSAQNNNLLLIVAGYQDYVWDKVFNRINDNLEPNIDVCIVVPGKDDKKLHDLCEEFCWSYLSTKENKLALAQNMAIKLHPYAEWIYKLDEDIFIGKNYFSGLKDTYIKAETDGNYKVGIISPTLNVNGSTYRYVLESFNKLREYESRFGKARMTCDDDPIYHDGEAAKFMWSFTLPIDETIRQFAIKPLSYYSVPIRLSIGAFLMKRELWIKMKGFRVAAAGQLAWEEMCLCEYCVNWSYTILVAQNVFAGHFGFGEQKSVMKQLFENEKDKF